MKTSLENNPLCTIEPNVDIVDVPDPRMARPDSKSYEPGLDATVFRGICPRFA
jgi:ribosome-binding ATPase YchF (GTP1/OBG family)